MVASDSTETAFMERFFPPLSRVFRDKNVSVHEYALLVLALRSAYLIWSVMTLGVL